MWMDLDRACYSESSKLERQMWNINTYLWNLKKWHSDFICKVEVETQT